MPRCSDQRGNLCHHTEGQQEGEGEGLSAGGETPVCVCVCVCVCLCVDASGLGVHACPTASPTHSSHALPPSQLSHSRSLAPLLLSCPVRCMTVSPGVGRCSSPSLPLHAHCPTLTSTCPCQVHDCVAKGGKVLIPVFAVGRAQELLLMLEEYWERLGLQVGVYGWECLGGSLDVWG